ncbi:hypothetical protein PQQ96_27635 [Paraburkholderia sediminicola]
MPCRISRGWLYHDHIAYLRIADRLTKADGLEKWAVVFGVVSVVQ